MDPKEPKPHVRKLVEARHAWTQAPDFLADALERSPRVRTAKKPGPSLPIYERLHSLRRAIDRLWEGIGQAEEYISTNLAKGTAEGNAAAEEWRRIAERYKTRLGAAEDEFWAENIPHDEDERLRCRNQDKLWRQQAKARAQLERLTRIVSPAETRKELGYQLVTPRPETKSKAPPPKESTKLSSPVAPSGSAGQRLTVVAQEGSDRRVLKGPTGGVPQSGGKVSRPRGGIFQ